MRMEVVAFHDDSRSIDCFLFSRLGEFSDSIVTCVYQASQLRSPFRAADWAETPHRQCWQLSTSMFTRCNDGWLEVG